MVSFVLLPTTALLLLVSYVAAYSPNNSPSGRRLNNGAAAPPAAVIVDSFAAFIRMRLGLDSTCSPTIDTSPTDSPGTSPTVYWVGSGELYEAYSGKILARFEGFDVGRGILVEPDHVRQLSRKIFFWKCPDSGELMTEFEGREVKPIRYDYQVFDYRRGPTSGMVGVGTSSSSEVQHPVDMNSIGIPLLSIHPSVVSGPRDVPVMPITAQTAGNNRLAFQAPVFVDIDIPNVGPYQAWEFYDYTVDLAYPEDQPPLAVWCRQGSNPPFVEDGRGVMRFVGHRVDCFDDLPASVRELVDGEYHLFREPPADMDEVERLHREQLRR